METTEEAQKILEFVNKAFDYSESPAEEPKFLNSLMDFVRIPNLSPLFDPEWNTNGLLMKACNHLKDFADGLGLQGYSSEVVKEDDLTPVLFMKLEPYLKTENVNTVLCYAHMDKQPWGEGWDEDKKPTEPVIQNGKLYGRGGADDGYGTYSALCAIKACQDNGLPHPRVYIFIEGAEESKEEDLKFYVNKFIKENKFEHNLDLIIALDSLSPSKQLFTSTASLRGIINFDLKVEAFKDNIHSGNSGIFADTFTVATDLIRRLENKETYLMNDEFQVEIPPHRLEEIQSAWFVGKISSKLPKLENVSTIPEKNSNENGEQTAQEIINSTWKSVLSVIGARGLPDCNIAGNCLRKQTTLTISIRTPPTIKTKDMFERIKEILSTDVPFNYKVSFDRVDLADGWDAKAHSEHLASWLSESVNLSYHNKPLFIGCGGAIPFAGILGENFPNADFLVTGSSLLDCNAHGPNENLDLESTINLTSALGLLFSKY